MNNDMGKRVGLNYETISKEQDWNISAYDNFQESLYYTKKGTRNNNAASKQAETTPNNSIGEN